MIHIQKEHESTNITYAGAAMDISFSHLDTDYTIQTRFDHACRGRNESMNWVCDLYTFVFFPENKAMVLSYIRAPKTLCISIQNPHSTQVHYLPSESDLNASGSKYL